MLNLPNKDKLQTLDLDTLKRLEHTVNAFMFKQSMGEPYAKPYRKNKKNFTQLVAETTSFHTALEKFMRKQAGRISKLVDLNKIKADEYDDYLNDDAWEEENQQLTIVIHPKAQTLFDLGIDAAVVQLKMQMSIDSSSAPVQKFLKNYALKLASDINETTKNDIKDQIKASLQAGETRQQLEQRITGIIDNSYRAQMIAQTESIRAFSAGRIAVGKRMGVKQKKWVTYGATDDACTSAEDQGAISIDSAFINGDDYPPAHPNCKCAVEFVMDTASVDDEEQDQSIDQSDLPDSSFFDSL